jgi:hypothetical protein
MHEGYTFKMALKSKAYLIPHSAVNRISRFKFLEKNFIVFEYELNYINRFLIEEKDAPSFAQLPIIDHGVAKRLREMLLPNAYDYFTKFYRYSSTMTYILFYLLMTTAFFYTKDWLLLHIRQDSWLVRGTCDQDCAKHFVQLFSSLMLVLFSAISIFMWVPIFYSVNKRKIRDYRFLTSMKAESFLLLILGVMMSGTMISSLVEKKNLQKIPSIISKYQAGTLTFKNPNPK